MIALLHCIKCLFCFSTFFLAACSLRCYRSGSILSFQEAASDDLTSQKCFIDEVCITYFNMDDLISFLGCFSSINCLENGGCTVQSLGRSKCCCNTHDYCNDGSKNGSMKAVNRPAKDEGGSGGGGGGGKKEKKKEEKKKEEKKEEEEKEKKERDSETSLKLDKTQEDSEKSLKLDKTQEDSEKSLKEDKTQEDGSSISVSMKDADDKQKLDKTQRETSERDKHLPPLEKSKKELSLDKTQRDAAPLTLDKTTQRDEKSLALDETQRDEKPLALDKTQRDYAPLALDQRDTKQKKYNVDKSLKDIDGDRTLDGDKTKAEISNIRNKRRGRARRLTTTITIVREEVGYRQTSKDRMNRQSTRLLSKESITTQKKGITSVLHRSRPTIVKVSAPKPVQPKPTPKPANENTKETKSKPVAQKSA